MSGSQPMAREPPGPGLTQQVPGEQSKVRGWQSVKLGEQQRASRLSPSQERDPGLASPPPPQPSPSQAPRPAPPPPIQAAFPSTSHLLPPQQLKGPWELKGPHLHENWGGGEWGGGAMSKPVE